MHTGSIHLCGCVIPVHELSKRLNTSIITVTVPFKSIIPSKPRLLLQLGPSTFFLRLEHLTSFPYPFGSICSAAASYAARGGERAAKGAAARAASRAAERAPARAASQAAERAAARAASRSAEGAAGWAVSRAAERAAVRFERIPHRGREEGVRAGHHRGRISGLSAMVASDPIFSEEDLIDDRAGLTLCSLKRMHCSTCTCTRCWC